MNTTFNPTHAQIQAAQKVFIAQAFVDVIKPAFNKIEQEIILNGNYMYDGRYFTEKWTSRKDFDLPKDRYIRRREDIYMIAGLTEFCEANRETKCTEPSDYSINNDAAGYYSELNRSTQNAGFINGQNALAMAESDLRQAQSQLIVETFSIHGCELDLVNSNLENRKKMINLLMGLFSKLVNSNIEQPQRKYFDERIKQLKAA